jgi:peptidoglycan/xylan/chitin deacetylase (PgdA/CDA1 family)
MRDLGLSLCNLEAALADSDHPLVALTFDDGLEAHYQEVMPLLVSREATATFFVTSSWVGRPGHVTWEQLREMAAVGMSIQSHTATHPFLSQLTREDVERELAASKADIEEAIGCECTTIALPGGDMPRGWRPADYARIGYRCVATSRWGPNDSRTPGSSSDLSVYFARRYTVRRDTPEGRLSRLALAMEPRYSPEGLRYLLTHGLRATMGAARYARWRRRALTALGR